MYKLSTNLAFTILLVLSLALVINAQDKKIIVNSDGSYSVIEYPVDKEVTVRLLPTSGITSTGTARVMRTAAGTKVVFDVTGAPAEWKSVYAYTVDPGGTPTFLGPITFTGGVGTAEFMTPSNQFMLVLSPNEGLTTYDTSTAWVFRSEVPAGFAVVPRGKVIAPVSAVAADVVTREVTTTAVTYDVPMLGIAANKGKKSEVRLKFGGELSGLEAKATLKPVSGKTQIRMTFDDMQKVPMNKRFVLWTSGPEGYTKVGQVIHAGKKDTAEIRGETSLSDFGLFLTVEDADVTVPTSRIYSTFTFVPAQ
jgi:hypothetical protein